MATADAPKKKKAKAAKKKPKINSFDRFKQFEGHTYTGMQIGRGHKWHYDQGTWKETKITPDLWEISYAVTKRRMAHAPEGSGVPVGTGYHWYVFAHQVVKKLDANDYTTEMTGLKYKLAHKRADKEKWSATAKTQRKHLVAFLKKMIKQLQQEPIPLEFEHKSTKYKGEALPIIDTCHDGVCFELEIMLNDEQLGIIRKMKSGWKMDLVKDQKLVKTIGEHIMLWYE
ncbi:MAG: hypothetical protein JWO09_1315 [Bacteroidetes bacterium]|nr:hypothetical protein [Bacteroidota bacterium]